MPFEIRQLSWHKRRRPTEVPRPTQVSIPDFKKSVNHACAVQVTFSDGSELALIGRVIQNPITGRWSVSAMNHQGHVVLVSYIEEDSNL
ncbi:hypothetical protein [Aliidiomarina sanyensis]|uniref:hypothetical protein n=1 Tax=Aliidiomarina sanyensis TaxID=1249555 RepID=UPI000F88D58F|nr:hypothetical protein [Aliidiomarina sanyensis]